MTSLLLLSKYWKYIVSGLFVILVGIYIGVLTHERNSARTLAKDTQTAFDTTVSNYQLAAVKAAYDAKQNVIKVKQAQDAITEKVTNDYQATIASSNDRYERLRAKTAGYLSHPATAGVPDSRETTCAVVAGTSCEAIPPLLKAAQDNTDKLIALQAWNRAQMNVDVGNDGP
ncbi:MAG TPA: hypothetical protein VN081_02785 [Dongiaceae bacterium]|nr:hypothetical protein [Dongiaceae bacterium]